MENNLITSHCKKTYVFGPREESVNIPLQKEYSELQSVTIKRLYVQRFSCYLEDLFCAAARISNRRCIPRKFIRGDNDGIANNINGFTSKT